MLTINKAIEIITVITKEQVYLLTPDSDDAVIMAADALIQYRDVREEHPELNLPLLKGETNQ